MPLLQWLNKDQAVRTAAQCAYRLLEPVPELSYGDQNSENLLIQGDNLEALKALLPFYAGKVKCIYIDPPYNTKSAFEHYDDNLEHSQWLSLIYPRLELLRELLAEDGSIWVSIDDREAHYLKVIMDEIFGRSKFIASNVWQKRYSRENREAIGDSHEYLFVYAMSPESFKNSRNYLPLGEKQLKLYKNPDDDPQGPWQSVSLLAQGYRPNQMYKIIAPSGREHYPPDGNCWKVIRSVYEKELQNGAIYFGKDGNGVPRRKQYLKNANGVVPWTWWPHEEAGHTDEAKKEANSIFGSEISFGTPKPERLIHRILHIATNPGDLVLDSFLGSATTAAVAHKMKRRYIGIELGEHAVTHCQPRLVKVVDGEQGGISKSVDWQGGGGFRFYKLGQTVFDSYGYINPEVRFDALAAHIWFAETRSPKPPAEKSPLLGLHNGVAYYLLYNGILGDRRPQGGNVLTSKVLELLPPHDGPKVIYGETTRLGPERLKQQQITFKQIPYDVRAL
ncbi:site-specific DNA-methyltransferase [Marinobacterium sp. MBR-109]|jgi:adenine-specific DNA-methyltransferase|uniref:site-specific DNA-methyltransferase n=1 Tax=Marinobacterium sp. MBR-109 TaxID=3156462 RepID=UPI0033964548